MSGYFDELASYIGTGMSRYVAHSTVSSGLWCGPAGTPVPSPLVACSGTDISGPI